MSVTNRAIATGTRSTSSGSRLAENGLAAAALAAGGKRSHPAWCEAAPGSCYEAVASDLLDLFERYDHNGRTAARNFLSVSATVCRLSNGSRIAVRFPGERSGERGGFRSFYAFDFQVELQRGTSRYAISQSDVCMELYSKLEAGALPLTQLRGVVLELAIYGSTPGKAPPAHAAIRREALSEFVQLHESRGKVPSPLLATVRMSTEELLEGIFWLLLRDELTEPLLYEGDRFAWPGRRAAVARCLEAIAAAEGRCSISDVILRTLADNAQLRSMMGIDYSPIEQIRPVLEHERRRLRYR